jgi:hypothetical protein
VIGYGHTHSWSVSASLIAKQIGVGLHTIKIFFLISISKSYEPCFDESLS